MFEIIIKESCSGSLKCFTLKDWLQIFSVFFAMIASFASLATVFEMKRQRRDSLKPEVVYADSEFKILYDNQKDYPKLIYNKIPKLFNIGNGAAKSIQISYTFNYEYCINQLKELGILNKYFDLEAKGAIKSLRNGYFPLESQIITAEIINSDKSVEIDLPYTYMEFLHAFINISLKDQLLGYDKLPRLMIEIKYNDIEKNKFHSNFILEPKVYQYRRSQIDGVIDYSADLKLFTKEIK